MSESGASAAPAPPASPRMSAPIVRDAYAARADEYVDLLGSVDAMSPIDRDRIGRWAEGVVGRILDAGCGPGHWTAFLHDQGHTAWGIDLVPGFIDRARAAFPGVRYRVASIHDLDEPDGTFGGVLAWYSLIHAEPDDVASALREVARILRPGGSLLIGFFDGEVRDVFPHAVTPAYRWPRALMRGLLEGAGYEIVSEESRTDPGARPHAAIEARVRA
ncbi:class I SAM-dependent methyltransferase [Microbacterium karelineae]|uniref:class I SAM-dependent methyltransferase n=1 Tax=Microbacterium karelineae TaxID=2654283 RepID=UPI001E620123|nr:class I SAM-dependent methyltransferase [Microbacterium karelineae]